MSELSRRGFFDRAASGLMGAALAGMLADDLRGADGKPLDLSPQQPHFAPRARSVIHLCMQGGPSQVDLFDPKPALQKYHESTPPRELTANAVFENDRRGKLMQSPWKFRQHGQSGAWMSELLPHLAREADSLCIVRSMYNVHPNHEPAIFKLQTGQTFPGHPSFGSWITYALGSENQSLPAYVVLADPVERLPTNGVDNWSSGYLPPLFQGTRMRPGTSPLLNLRPDFSEPVAVTEAKRDLIARLDHIHRQRRPSYEVLDSRMRNYEMAARMQLEATEALATQDETQQTLDMYGIGQTATDNYGRQCLLARRLVERGVRFVQLFCRGQEWDNHRNLGSSLAGACQKTDQPVAALLRDLRQRGLLDSTLVLWGGEFGRLPMAQGDFKTAGRDHGPYGFSVWLAGGGVRGGMTYGSTDEIGYAAVENRVSIQDWHATILHLLGMDYERLVFKRHGLGERLTHQFETRVVGELLESV
ncbi:MAG: DUF1501 domain-containing protein [Planctomycetales bacterium]|nr:DUF1501 domain-containing protein [Planctomycetales bacterium]